MDAGCTEKSCPLEEPKGKIQLAHLMVHIKTSFLKYSVFYAASKAN